MRFRKKILGFFFFLLALIVGVFAANIWVERSSAPYLYTELNQIPTRNAALLLGTSRYVKSGQENLYFRYRIRAALDLYLAGKYKYLVVSGDNSRSSYNEPRDMFEALTEAGIPDTAIYLDYAGFRTFDSVIRCKEIFGQDSFLIISQPFHNERAVYIARNSGLAATAFQAQDVRLGYGFKTQVREYLARVNLLGESHIWGAKPHFLGEKIRLGDSLQWKENIAAMYSSPQKIK